MPDTSRPRFRRAAVVLLALLMAASLARAGRDAARAAVARQWPILTAGQPAQLDVRASGDRSVRVTLRPLALTGEPPADPALAARAYPPAALSVRSLTGPVRKRIGGLDVELRPGPLAVTVRTVRGQLVQEVVFEDDGRLSIALDTNPVLGMGEGGPRPAPGRP